MTPRSVSSIDQPSAIDAELPLADAARRLRRPAGRPRRGLDPPSTGYAVQDAPLRAAKTAAETADFAATLPLLEGGRGLPLPAASRYSGVPVRALWRLIGAGALPVVRVPGMRAVLVLRDDLDALLVAHRGAHESAVEPARSRA